MFEYEVEKELGNSICINHFGTRGKNYPLCKAMVDHDHQRIESVGQGKISDEINQELFEGKGGGGGDWSEGVDGWVISLFCWQTSHPETNLETKNERPSHQKSRSTTALV